MLGCGRNIAGPVYFFSFIVIVTILILNLFVAVILTTTEEITKIEDLSISRYNLYQIKKAWRDIDHEGIGYLDFKKFWRFSSKIALIFNVKEEDLLDISNKKDFLKALNLPVYENAKNKMFYYEYHEVVISLAKVALMLKYEILKLFLKKKNFFCLY